TGDADVLGYDPEEWAASLVDRHGMEPVQIDPDNPMTMKEIPIGGYLAVRVVQPMLWTSTLTVIARDGLAGQAAWLGFDYTAFFDSRFEGTIGRTVPPDAGNVAN